MIPTKVAATPKIEAARITGRFSIIEMLRVLADEGVVEGEGAELDVADCDGNVPFPDEVANAPESTEFVGGLCPPMNALHFASSPSYAFAPVHLSHTFSPGKYLGSGQTHLRRSFCSGLSTNLPFFAVSQQTDLTFKYFAQPASVSKHFVFFGSSSQTNCWPATKAGNEIKGDRIDRTTKARKY